MNTFVAFPSSPLIFRAGGGFRVFDEALAARVTILFPEKSPVRWNGNSRQLFARV